MKIILRTFHNKNLVENYPPHLNLKETLFKLKLEINLIL